MIPILAQSNVTPPAGFESWLANGFYLVGFVAACVVLYQRLRPRPAVGTEILGQPLEVLKADEFTPVERTVKLEERVDGLDEQIRAGFDRLDHKRSVSVAGLHDDLELAITDLRKEVKADIGGVHDRINDVLAAVSELKGRVAK